jgi:alpha-N-arabinofuranosidase
MRPEYYADVYKRYACYLRNQPENRLYKIAVGASSGDYRWTEVLMREAGRHMDGLSLHHYTVTGSWGKKGSATVFSDHEWFTCLQKAFSIQQIIERHGSIMDAYDPERRVGLVVDEWGTWHDVEPGTNPSFLYQQNTLRDAMVAGLTLNILNRHANRVHMANIAQTVNVLQAMVLTEEDKLILTPSYHVFGMYQGHQDGTLVPIEVACVDYENNGESIPSVDASASIADSGAVLLTVCNLDPNRPATLNCEIRGAEVKNATGVVLTADDMRAHNTFESPEAVTPQTLDGVSISGTTVTVELPAKSVMALTLQE